MEIIKNKITLIIAFIGLLGGIIWTLQSNFNTEPIILVCISLAEVVGYFLFSDTKTPDITPSKNKIEQNVNVNVNVEASPIQNLNTDKPSGASGSWRMN